MGLMQARQADIAPTVGKDSRAGDLFFIDGTTAGGIDPEHGAGRLDGIFGESYN